MDYIKPVMWDGKPLDGMWRITIKMDGIRALRKTRGGPVVSRNGKPLYNLDEHDFLDAEVFLGTFDKTVTACRTKNEKQIIPKIAVFCLTPIIDPRLDLGTIVNPPPARIWEEYKRVVDRGFEGLVLWGLGMNNGLALKVKKKETIDVKVIGFYSGKGKNKGKLGGFITSMGRVGTGLSDKQRSEWYPAAWKKYGEKVNIMPKDAKDHLLFGTTIECDCMEITKARKMRKPRFVRLRPDK